MVNQKTQFAAFNIGTSKVVGTSMDIGGFHNTLETSLNGVLSNDWLSGMIRASKAINEQKDFLDLVSTCGTAGTFLLVDEKGEPVTQPTYYNDRNDLALEKINRILLSAGMSKISQDSVIPNLYSAWHSLSAKEQSKVQFVVPQSVWLLYKMVIPDGNIWSDIHSDTTNLSKLGFSHDTGSWAHELFTLLDIPERILPLPVQPGEHCGIASGKFAKALGINGANVHHGVIDANAEALYLIGDKIGEIGIISGSTSVVKATSDSPKDLPQSCHSRPHPISRKLQILTAWATVGENLRRKAQISDNAVEELVKSAWEVKQSLIKPIDLKTNPIIGEYDHLSVDGFVRSVIESSVWWESERLKDMFNVLEAEPESILMIGGTTRDKQWMELRAASFEKKIKVFPAIGTIGAALPGLLKSGMFTSFEEFAISCRMESNLEFSPREMTKEEQHRKQIWDNHFG